MNQLRKWRELSRLAPSKEELVASLQEMLGTTDRTVAVMFPAFIEASLERLILTRLRADLTQKDSKAIFDDRGLFATFASKISAAYALSLIGPTTRDDLNVIRDLRNIFAHARVLLNFTTPEVKVQCLKLKVPDLPDRGLNIVIFAFAPEGRQHELLDKNHPRSRFVTACHGIALGLNVATSGKEGMEVSALTEDPLP